MSQIIPAQFFSISMIVVVLFGCIGCLFVMNVLLKRVLSGPQKARRLALVRPWLFLLPALSMMALYLVFPLIRTLFLSLQDDAGQWVGAQNYLWLAGSDAFRESLRNNLLWLIIVPAAASFLGLLAAGLTDRSRWRAAWQSLIFMPMAISFVGAAVIWKFIYDFRGEGQGAQLGLLNALTEYFGGSAQPWMTLPIWNSLFLMGILVWIKTGFAMVIFSAALRALPEDTIDAARLDGAGSVRIFCQIQVPQIWGTIAVVWTTITVIVLKVFDIVFAMTNGQWGTQVMANLMYDWMFRAGDAGRAAAVAVVLMGLVTPVMIWNLWQMRRNEHRNEHRNGHGIKRAIEHEIAQDKAQI